MRNAPTPAALKWLAEKRARIAAELDHIERICLDAQTRQAKLSADLAAVDRTIEVYDPSLRPTDITPVQARTLYGKRGSLRKLVLAVVTEHAPEWVASDVVALRVLMQHPVDFATPTARKRWFNNSLKSALKDLANQGKVEREHDADDPTGQVGRWRLRQVQPSSLAVLRALAERGADRNEEDAERPEVAGRETRPGGA